MSMIRFFVIIFLVFVSVVSSEAASDIDMPKMKVVKVKEPVTRALIDILPGRGVKCIFPWILDEKAAPTPARVVITNDAVFEQLRGDQQNAIEFRIKAKGQGLEGEVCDAFISVEGFHFVFTLRVNFSKRSHYSTILFDLEEEKKYELISESIKKHRAELEKQLAAAGQDLDVRAKKQSLKLIAHTVLSKPQKTNVYEKESKKLINGDRIIFKADQIISYGDIHILKINIENDSRLNPLYVNGIQIEKTSGNIQPLFCQHEIEPRINAGEKAEGFVVTQDPRIINKEDTRMKLLTNQGEVVLEW